jgi:predicted nucleotidyltransferase
VDGGYLDLLIDVTKSKTLIDVIQAQQLIEAELGIRVELLTARALPEVFQDSVLGGAQLLQLLISPRKR